MSTRWMWMALVVLSAARLEGSTNTPHWRAVFTNRFEQGIAGSAPAGFMALDGAFALNGSGELALPGEPVGDFVALFGPSKRDGVDVQGRMKAAATGRRRSAFALGAGGRSGFRLRIAPASKELQIVMGADVRSRVSFEAPPDQWIWLRIRVVREGADWKVSGRAWSDGTAEPEEWLVEWLAADQPPSGKCSIWGEPFAGKEILFDDVEVRVLDAP